MSDRARARSVTLSHLRKQVEELHRLDEVRDLSQDKAVPGSSDGDGHCRHPKEFGHAPRLRYIHLALDPALQLASDVGVGIRHGIHLLTSDSPGRREVQEDRAVHAPRVCKELLEVLRKPPDVHAFRRRARDILLRRHDLWLVAQILDDTQDLSRRDFARVVADIEAFGVDVEPNLANARQPFQGSLNPIGSPQSCDPFGLDEACDFEREDAFTRRHAHRGTGGHDGEHDACEDS